MWKTLRLAAFIMALAPMVSTAHPVPDVPVRAWFETNGTAVIGVEVDLRVFEADPEATPYFQNALLNTLGQPERRKLFEDAREFIRKSVEFRFEPLGRSDPEFEFSFTTPGGGPLARPDDPVVMTGEWRTKLPAGLEGYRIKALDAGNLSVLFINHINGEALERVAVLFPGETSFLLDLTRLTASMPAEPSPGSVGAEPTSGGRWATFVDFMREGFVHVLPKGLDHILFVLGLFLMSREWRPLLLQVTTFTVAHTITLALATLGIVSVPSAVVEPVIAGSIAVVAIENLVRRKYAPSRLVIVLVFGLIHGLGFAGALEALDLPRRSLALGLVGFNVGVEFGQLAVIALAFAATFWIRDAARYRKWIVIPGSTGIAIMGLWWMVTRVFVG